MPRWPSIREPDSKSLEVLTTTLEGLINGTDLPPEQKTWLRSRWLAKVRSLRRKEDRTRNRFYALRGIAITSSLTVPALVSLNVQGDPALWVRWSTVLLSLVAAISSAAIDLIRFGPRWRIYRAFSEQLESQGWQFLELTGSYQGSHQEALPTFVETVEQAINEYNRDYEADVMSVTIPDRS